MLHLMSLNMFHDPKLLPQEKWESYCLKKKNRNKMQMTTNIHMYRYKQFNMSNKKKGGGEDIGLCRPERGAYTHLIKNYIFYLSIKHLKTLMSTHWVLMNQRVLPIMLHQSL